jgi:hypothetical protein
MSILSSSSKTFACLVSVGVAALSGCSTAPSDAASRSSSSAVAHRATDVPECDDNNECLPKINPPPCGVEGGNCCPADADAGVSGTCIETFNYCVHGTCQLCGIPGYPPCITQCFDSAAVMGNPPTCQSCDSVSVTLTSVEYGGLFHSVDVWYQTSPPHASVVATLTNDGDRPSAVTQWDEGGGGHITFYFVHPGSYTLQIAAGAAATPTSTLPSYVCPGGVTASFTF